MLIVNQKQINENTSEGDLKAFAREYKDGITELKARFPYGNITLKRNGYPKHNRLPDGTNGLREDPPPLYIKMTRSVSGVEWGCCKGRPLIHANGLMEVPPDDNFDELSGEFINIDLKARPDYAFFIIYKSGVVPNLYNIYDPEGDRLLELREKNSRRQVSSLIWNNLEDNKIRLLAQAWGVKNAGKADILVLKDDLEKKVFAMEERRKKEPTNLMLRGIEQFLSDAKNDDLTRPKAIVQMGIDEKRITLQKDRYYFDGEEICFVPYGHEEPSSKQEFLVQFIRNKDNKEKWLKILKGLITKEYVDGSDKYGVRYLAGEIGIAVNQKEDVLREKLLEFLTQ